LRNNIVLIFTVFSSPQPAKTPVGKGLKQRINLS